MSALTKVLGGACTILAFWLWWVMGSYGELKGNYSTLKDKFSEQVAITADYEKRINSLHELDTKHTTELTNAKAEIDQLRIDVSNGTKRLRVKAECPSSENSSTSSVDDGTAARPTDSAVRNYWLLRNRIAELTRMVLGLQDYIRTECLR